MPGSLLTSLGLTSAVLAAPMAGGPTTTALVRAAAEAGGLGFLASGYKTPSALADEIDTVAGWSIPFGVNVFAPNPLPVDPGEFRAYASVIAAEAERLGVDLADARPVEDDDFWRDKIDVLTASPVPVVSFTFGIPGDDVVTALHRAGSLLVQTVTSVEEGRAAVAAGMDAVAVQATVAGGHWGTLTPRRPVVALSLAELVRDVRAAVDRPVIAAGGLASTEDVAATLAAGAEAVAVGTVLLLADEAGTSATHRAALADPARESTVITHAFTGRPARGLRNDFIDRYDGLAPYGYPAVHHLTSAMRKAAAAAGDGDRLHLWAGTGYRAASAEPAVAILRRLATST